MLKICYTTLYNIIFSQVEVKCAGCNTILRVNAYDYHKNKSYSCNMGCALLASKKEKK